MKERYNDFSTTPVAIPIIQRDYVQGSDNNAEKRDKFLESLLQALAEKTDYEIDFIYGSSDSNGHFMPVDGQQRLTTLTLLAWVLNHKSGYSLSDRLPSITYMTRP